MKPYDLDTYRKLRAAGRPLDDAMRCARVAHRFKAAEAKGLVKLEAVPDDEPYDLSYVDTWTDLSPRRREAWKKQIVNTINREGVWGYVACYRPCPSATWEQASSVWSNVGMDDLDDAYDLMGEALDALDAAHAMLAEDAAARATYAGVAP